MTVGDLTVGNSRGMRLRVTSEADPGALSRVLAQFQNINIIPHRVVAELDATGLIQIEIDVVSVPEARVALMAGRIAQAVPIMRADWQHIQSP